METSFLERSRVAPPEPPTLGVAAPAVTVVVPTYREAPNLPELFGRLARVRESGLDLDVLVMDDDSRDGSVEAVAAFGADWIEIVVRTANRSLSAAITEGLCRARGDVIVVMNANLRHPPEAVPALVGALLSGPDLVFGSVDRGSIDEARGTLHHPSSRLAARLARSLTRAADPMAGFFALRRASLEGAALEAFDCELGLELVVKSGLRRLSAMAAAVVASGLLPSLLALGALVAIGAPMMLAVALAIATSMLSSFALGLERPPGERATAPRARGAPGPRRGPGP